MTTSTKESKMTYRIPAANFASLNDKLAKLTRRAVKLNLAVPTLRELRIEDEAGKDGFINRFHIVEIESVPIAISGYTFVAKVEIGDSEVGHIVAVVPGEAVPASYRNTDTFCEHCETSRRRNAVYVVREDATGTHKQVGRNCLGQFLGGIDPAEVCSRLETAIDFESMVKLAEESTGRASEFISLRAVLLVTDLVIRCKGWVSKGKAMESADGTVPTVGHVKDAIFNYPNRDLIVKDYMGENEANEEKVEKAIEWAKGVDSSESDYLHNLKVVCSAEALNIRHMGIACSLLAAYDRATAVKVENAASDYVGTVGKRDAFTLILNRTMILPGYMGGASYLYLFSDQNGNSVTWKASKDCDLTDGNSYSVTGSVKEHKEFRGKKQTSLTRCKVAI